MQQVVVAGDKTLQETRSQHYPGTGGGYPAAGQGDPADTGERVGIEHSWVKVGMKILK